MYLFKILSFCSLVLFNFQLIRSKDTKKNCFSIGGGIEYYSSLSSSSSIPERFRKKRDAIENFVLSKMGIRKIFDVGCNKGWMSERFLDCGMNVFGVDLDSRFQKFLHPQMKFKVIDIVTSNEVFFNDCTLFLSVYHHLVTCYGLKVADDVFYKLLLRTNYLIIDFAVPGKEPQNPSAITLNKLFKDQDDVYKHFGIPYKKIGSWPSTPSAERDIVVFEKNDFDKSALVVNKFKKLDSERYAHWALIPVELHKKMQGTYVKNKFIKFKTDKRYFKLKVGNKFFFAKKFTSKKDEQKEIDLLTKTFNKVPSVSFMQKFYGVSKRYGLIFEWRDAFDSVLHKTLD
jgi:hypothetical protein